MRLPSDIPMDSSYHQYCLNCWHEAVERVQKDGKTYYSCKECHKTQDRSLVVDPAITAWLDDSRVYWHESAGVFVCNTEGQVLLFKRTIFPFSMTVPSGHVDSGEDPLTAARRELAEETNINVDNIELRELATEAIHGDSCRRGSDDHVWHAFVATVPTQNVQIKEEGIDPVWLTVSDALQQELTVPVRFMLERFGHELSR